MPPHLYPAPPTPPRLVPGRCGTTAGPWIRPCDPLALSPLLLLCVTCARSHSRPLGGDNRGAKLQPDHYLMHISAATSEFVTNNYTDDPPVRRTVRGHAVCVTCDRAVRGHAVCVTCDRAVRGHAMCVTGNNVRTYGGSKSKWGKPLMNIRNKTVCKESDLI